MFENFYCKNSYEYLAHQIALIIIKAKKDIIYYNFLKILNIKI